MVKHKWIISSALIAIIVIVAFYEVLQAQQNANPHSNTLFQLAAFNTFSLGSYSGVMSYGDLKKHGDFGIGTFDGLNGEMIALNGVFYQVPSDGNPIQVNDMQTSPYATITYFHSDQTLPVQNINYTQLKAQLDLALPSQNAIYAIKVSGTFSWAQTRSPAKQVEPYPDLTNALKNQSVFNLTGVSATAVGFWFPSSMNGVDYVGYHLHLITDDHKAGGHLLDFILNNATVELGQINSYNLMLP